MTESLPKASVVFATKNRRDDLRRALASVVSQEGVALEIIVMDDGSTDGTAEMVKSEFPTAHIEWHKECKGVAVRRTEGARLASAPFIFSIDSDALYTTPFIIRDTLPEFDHPRIGAVAIPHVDVKVSPNLITPTPPTKDRWVISAFVGTAYAVRRDVFLSLDGYRAILVHSTEERDFCIRMLNSGYVTRVGQSDPVHHFHSPIREARLERMLERRNDVCHAVWDVPFPHLLYHLPGTILSGLNFGMKNNCLAPTLEGYWKAPGVCWKERRLRHPIARSVYSIMRRLNRHLYLPLEQVEPFLPPLPNATRPQSTPSNTMGAVCF